MSKAQGRFSSFITEYVPVRRWRLYSHYFLVISLGLVSIQALVERMCRPLWIAFPLMAAAVTALNFLADWGKANGQRPTTNDRP